MKKVLVLVAAVALFATPAMATIVNSAHDLTSNDAGANTQVCVYCHTPHGADTTVTNAPLWNRSTVSATGTVYKGVEIDALNTMSLIKINQTDAPLCLSCHDGTLTETLNNEPNANVTTAMTDIAGEVVLGTDMSNDHPIGFEFTPVSGADPGIDTKANAESDLGLGALSFGAGDEMWCSSCHDVHDNTTAKPFLRLDNAASALCIACHLK